MAYYSYNNYDQGEFSYGYDYSYSSNSYYTTYYPAPLQNQNSFANSNSSIDYQIFAYDPIPSKISYSVSIPAQPEYIEYDPAENHYSSQTRFSTSYSLSEFNEPEFEDYDPTPYGGGYDPVLTYGKPLPPSDDICYPRSAAAPPAGPLNSVPSPPIATPAGRIEEESKPTAVVTGNDAVSGGEEESNYGSNFGSGSREDGYGYGKETGQMPYGYGLEAMDICESLFGYWPCISRYRRRFGDSEQAVDRGNCSNDPWNGAADYLFGNPNPYEERRNGDENSYGSSMYGYQMQHSLHGQGEDSWS